MVTIGPQNPGHEGASFSQISQLAPQHTLTHETTPFRSTRTTSCNARSTPDAVNLIAPIFQFCPRLGVPFSRSQFVAFPLYLVRITRVSEAREVRPFAPVSLPSSEALGPRAQIFPDRFAVERRRPQSLPSGTGPWKLIAGDRGALVAICPAVCKFCCAVIFQRAP